MRLKPGPVLLALALGSAAGPSQGAPCAGFTDVQDTEVFCPAVEWLKNRSITAGCTSSTLFCPGSAVSRGSMALFLNRLGTALTPAVSFVEAALATVDPDAAPTLCATGPIVSTLYPRQALVSIAFAGQSAGDLGYSARPLVSTDNGANWTPLGAIAIRESVTGAAWTNAAASGVYAIPAFQPVRFALRVERETGSADFTQGRCHLIASVLNANGSVSPF